MIVAEVDDETPVVLTVNVAVVAPAATVTEAGTVALVLLDDRVTAAPPVPAALERVTVPVEEFPPETDVGLTATEVTVGPLIVSVAVLCCCDCSDTDEGFNWSVNWVGGATVMLVGVETEAV